MAMRDLIPWNRDQGTMPTAFREEERSPFMSLRREMDRLFDDFFHSPMLGGGAAMTWPSLEIKETDDEVRIVAELPGMSERDVELIVQDGLLTLRGERRSESGDRDRGWSELHYGRFERRIALPDGADEESCEANFRDGMLTVRMAKSPRAARGRKIPINAATRH